MVQIANFERPNTNVSHGHEVGRFMVTTTQLHGNDIFHQVSFPVNDQRREVALFAHPTKLPLVDVLRTVHDLVFLWIPPVTDPRALIMTSRDEILDACKEQVRLLVGPGTWPVQQFHRVDETEQATLHLTRYHDVQLDRIITMAVGTASMDLHSADSVDSAQGTGIVRVSPSWVDPGPFTLHDQHYAKTDAEIAIEEQARREALADKMRTA